MTEINQKILDEFEEEFSNLFNPEKDYCRYEDLIDLVINILYDNMGETCWDCMKHSSGDSFIERSCPLFHARPRFLGN